VCERQTAAGTLPSERRRNQLRQYRACGSSGMFSTFAMTAGVDESCIWQQWFADIDSELEEFTMNSRCAPAWIGQIHLSYQSANLVICWRTAIARSTLPCPVKSESLAIPGDNCLRLYNSHHRTPTTP